MSGTPRERSPLEDVRNALHNAGKLGTSLVLTWGIGIVVRLFMPRYLGPDRFGLLSFADGIAATAVGCLSLGVDTYVQKEIPLRPRHASDFMGGVVVTRALLTLGVILTLQLLPWASRDEELASLLAAFAVGYLFFAMNGTYACLLQANATVDELALANTAVKIVWGAGIGAGLVLRLPLLSLALVFAASEAVKVFLLHMAARRHLRLRLRFDARGTWAVMRGSLSFYGASLVQTLGARLDIVLLGFLASDVDVGWFAAAWTLAGITLLLAPLMLSVLLPLLTRLQAQSPPAMLDLVRRSLELIVVVGTPTALLVGLGADLWVRLAFGRAFAPSAESLRILAPMFVLTYVNILLWMTLLVRGGLWRLTAVSVVGIAVGVPAALVTVPLLGRLLGPGGAGAGMATSILVREVVVVACLIALGGREAFDPPRRRVVARSLVAALGAGVVHLALAPLTDWRVVPAVLTYLALAIQLGALKPRVVAALVRDVLGSRPR